MTVADIYGPLHAYSRHYLYVVYVMRCRHACYMRAEWISNTPVQEAFM